MQAKRRTRQHPLQQTDVASPAPSIIGSTLVMKGELTLDEDLIVNGTIIGSISGGTRRVSVTTFAKVQGNVHTASAEIAGTMDGDVSGGSNLLLRRTAQLNGTLSADSVVVEQGTNLENVVLTGRVTCGPKKQRP